MQDRIKNVMTIAKNIHAMIESPIPTASPFSMDSLDVDRI